MTAGSELPLRFEAGAVSLSGETAVFGIEMPDAPTSHLAFDLDALPDLAMGVAAVLHAARATEVNSEAGLDELDRAEVDRLPRRVRRRHAGR